MELPDFLAKLNGSLSAAEANSVLHCEDAFRDFLRDFNPSRIFNKELRDILGDKLWVSADWRDYELYVAGDKRYTILVSHYHRQSEHLYSYPFDGFIAPLGCRPLVYDLYEVPESMDWEVFDRSRKLRYLGRQTVAVGGYVRIDNKRNIYNFLPENRPTALKLYSGLNCSIQWVFDATTLSAFQAVAASGTDTELCVIAEVLADFGDSSSADVLDRLSYHSSHHVRWAAIKSLAQIDYSRAVTRLKSALHDSHPHIRGAALRTLAASGLAEL